MVYAISMPMLQCSKTTCRWVSQVIIQMYITDTFNAKLSEHAEVEFALNGVQTWGWMLVEHEYASISAHS